MLVNTRSKQDASPTDQKSLTKFEFTTITSKTGTSPIAWASNHWVPLYKQSPRKRLILPQKKPSTPLLPDSIIASNSSNSIPQLDLNTTQYLFLFSPLSCPANLIYIPFLAFIMSCQSHIYFALFSAKSPSIQTLPFQNWCNQFCHYNKLNSILFFVLFACYTDNFRCLTWPSFI